MSRVAPTTARSPEIPPGCALMVASVSRLQPISRVAQALLPVFQSGNNIQTTDSHECLSYCGRLPICSAAIPPVKF
jgi:hypothetical protein